MRGKQEREKSDRTHQTSIVVGTLLYIMNTTSIVYICFRERTRLYRPTDWLTEWRNCHIRRARICRNFASITCTPNICMISTQTRETNTNSFHTFMELLFQFFFIYFLRWIIKCWILWLEYIMYVEKWHLFFIFKSFFLSSCCCKWIVSNDDELMTNAYFNYSYFLILFLFFFFILFFLILHNNNDIINVKIGNTEL